MINFLSDNIWTTIKTLSEKSRQTKIAVAYFGTGAATILKLKKGDTLLVAMTLPNVKAGQVNPSEIEKLYDKGVNIFNLPNLHSKIYLFDKKVIIGSANVSSNSVDTLIETAVLTDDIETVAEAGKFINDNCIERVEKDYIKICKENYNPPKFFGIKRKQTKDEFKGQLSTLWIISTKITPWKEADFQAVDADRKAFEKKISNRKALEVNEVKYGASHRFINKVEEGDIIIELINNGKRAQVIEPKRALGVTWDRERRVAFLRTEQAKKPITKSWSELERILHRNHVKAVTKGSTRQIVNEATKKILLDYFN